MMRLNGWQRLYVVAVLAWVTYLVTEAYTGVTHADSLKTDLTSAIERLEAQAVAEPDSRGITHHLTISNPQMIEHYQHQLNGIDSNKRSMVVTALFLATVPPLFIYIIIAWIAAGFRKQNNAAN